MPLLENVRRFFSRSKSRPVEIDLTGPDTGRQDDVEPAEPRLDSQSEGDTALTSRRGRSRSMAELQRGYDEVMGLVRKVSDHLDDQSQRTEKMMNLLEHLPQAIDALPEINRQSARLQETLTEHLTQAKRREEALNSTLDRLTDASGHHTEVLGLLQQQLDAGSRSAEQMTETLGSFREALSNLATTTSRSSDVLARMADSTEERESRLVMMLGRTQRWLIGAVIGCGALAVIAIVLALIAINS